MTTVRTILPRLAGALALFALLLGGCAKHTTQPPVPPVVVPLSSLTLAPHADTLVVGGQSQVVATTYDTLGALVGNVAITWTSADNAIVTVSGSGLLTGRGEGAAWVFAASGGKKDSTHVLVTGARGWTLQPGATAGSNLAGVFFRPAGRLGWVVGSGGRIVHTSDAGGAWAAQSSATMSNLNAVWFTSDLKGVAVGDGGTVMNTSNGGTSWTRNVSVATLENLLDVKFVDATHGWAVGTNGLVLKTINGGTVWTKRILATSFALHSVAFADTLDGWVVGDGGTVYGTHDGGRSWYPVGLSTSQSLRGVSRWDAEHTLAVGQLGTVGVALAGRDSVVWSLPLPNAGANNQLEKCQLVGVYHGYAVGYNAGLGGAVLYTADGGATWQSQISNTSVRLNGVFFADSLRGWVVGDGGVILHTGHGGFAP